MSQVLSRRLCFVISTNDPASTGARVNKQSLAALNTSPFFQIPTARWLHATNKGYDEQGLRDCITNCIARTQYSRPQHSPFQTGLSAWRYLLSNGSSFGEGLRGPKGFEGEVGLEPLCCGEVRTFHQSSVFITGTFIARRTYPRTRNMSREVMFSRWT